MKTRNEFIWNRQLDSDDMDLDDLNYKDLSDYSI